MQPISRVHALIEIKYDEAGDLSVQMCDAKDLGVSTTLVVRKGCSSHLDHGAEARWVSIEHNNEVRLCPVLFNETNKQCSDFSTYTFRVDCPFLKPPVERTPKVLVDDHVVGRVI